MATQDVLIKSDKFGLYDWQIDGADFASAEGFETAIPLSYFTDARAPAVHVQQAKDRRGWVGNILYIDIERELGGLLWLLDQARNTQDTRNLAKSFCEGSLQWMPKDGVARSISVEVTQPNDTEQRILTNITNPDNTVSQYTTLWRSTDFARTITS
jgi:phage gp46-like protein